MDAARPPVRWPDHECRPPTHRHGHRPAPGLERLLLVPWAHAGALVQPDPEPPLGPDVHQLRDDAVRLATSWARSRSRTSRRGPPRSRSACAPAASTTTSTPSGARPGTCRSSRCWATSASATTSRPRPSRGPGSSSPRCSASTATGSGSPCTPPTTRPRRSGPTRWACPRDRIQRLRQGQLLGDGRDRSVRSQLRAVLRLRTGGAARTGARPTLLRSTATSSSGTWCSPSTSGVTDGALTDLPTRNVDTGAGLERILAVLAGSPSLYAADVLAGLVDQAQAVTGANGGGFGAGRRSPCGSWPTTPARRRSSWPTASSRPTRTGATCCAASSAGPCASPTCSTCERAGHARHGASAASTIMGDAYPELVEQRDGDRRT